MEKLFSISIDKLEVTYQATDTMIDNLSKLDKLSFDGFWLERKESLKYKNEFIIWCNDYNNEYGGCISQVGYLYFGSYNPNRQDLYVTYNNKSLYTWVLGAREYIETCLELSFLKISKLDIAIDFNFNVQSYILKIYKNAEFRILICGKEMPDEEVKGVAVYAGDNPRNRLFSKPELIIGNSSKTLTLKSYNKSKEIEQSSGKDYIIDNCGFKRVYRMEITCKNHKVLKPSIEKLGVSELELWERISDRNLLFDLFEHLIDRLIRFKKGRKSYSLLYLVAKNLK